MVKARRSAAAESAQKLVRSSASSVKATTRSLTIKAANGAALRPVVVGMGILVLIWLALTFMGKFQLWMTSAGVFMIVMSMASAFHEVKNSKNQSLQDFLDEEMNGCGSKNVSLPHLSPVKASTVKANAPVVVNHRRNVQQQQQRAHSSLSISSVKLSPPAPTQEVTPDVDVDVESQSAAATSQHNSEVGNTVDVLHCGTVIDIQGLHGFIIPHDLGVNPSHQSSAAPDSSMNAQESPKQHRIPLVIPFDLKEDQQAIREEIAVGKTVEFAYSACDNDCTGVCALNVTLVSSPAEEISRSRNALLTCKQAREESFAKAMGALKMISPRNEPVKHHVDLIKYAEKLDDHELPFDQFI